MDSPSDWRYTAEGGANLVLSYTGSDPAFIGKLLRLRKRKKLGSSAGPIGEDVDLRFSEQVIAPLLGREFVVEMRKVEVRREFLEALRAELDQEGVRPPDRKLVDEVDVEDSTIVLAEDLVHGAGVLAVEIKPKWGFLPSPSHLSPKSKSIKTTYCRFCMHSHLKRQKLGISQEPASTEYCPLGLYSGDLDRTSTALHQLWETWKTTSGEANNLRLFLDGDRIFPNESMDLERLAHLLGTSTDPSTLFSSFRALLLPVLLASPLLPTLKHLQSSLDFLDIEGLSSVLLKRGTSLEEASSEPQPTIDEWIAWRARWIARESPPSSQEEIPTRDLVLAYLLSASFKDCSIFNQLRRSDGKWESKLKAIDLDPKPLKRLTKYRALDEEIVKTYQASLMEEGKESNTSCLV